MKKSTKYSIAILLLLSIKTITAQVSADLEGVITKANSNWGRGGFGMNILSGAINPTDIISNHIECRLGGGFYFSGIDQKTISNVPLTSQQTGNALVTLTNRVHGINGIARFSLPYSNTIIPYCDIFAGLRGFTTNMNISPYQIQNGCNTCNTATSKNISALDELDFGVSGGVMLSLSKSVKLDVGLTYSDSNHIGKTIDVNSAHLQSGTIEVNQTNALSDMLLATIGLTFCFDGSMSKWASDHSSSSPSTPYNNYNNNYSYPSSPYHNNYLYPSSHSSNPCPGGGSNVNIHVSSGKAK